MRVYPAPLNGVKIRFTLDQEWIGKYSRSGKIQWLIFAFLPYEA